MHAVYRLVDPRNSETFYVGIAEDVYTRFFQHLRCDGSNPAKDARIQELRDANMMVVMETLQLVDGLELAKKREAYWIRHFYDLGVSLTNQVMPMVQDNITVVYVPASQAKTRLKAGMTADEQREVILEMLNAGLSRRKILARVDGYIHPKIVDHILNEHMAQSLAEAVGAVATQAANRAPRNRSEQGTARRMKEFTPEQELEFVQKFEQYRSIKRTLSEMGVSYGDYQACASRLVARKQLRGE